MCSCLSCWTEARPLLLQPPPVTSGIPNSPPSDLTAHLWLQTQLPVLLNLSRMALTCNSLLSLDRLPRATHLPHLLTCGFRPSCLSCLTCARPPTMATTLTLHTLPTACRCLHTYGWGRRKRGVGREAWGKEDIKQSGTCTIRYCGSAHSLQSACEEKGQKQPFSPPPPLALCHDDSHSHTMHSNTMPHTPAVTTAVPLTCRASSRVGVRISALSLLA